MATILPTILLWLPCFVCCYMCLPMVGNTAQLDGELHMILREKRDEDRSSLCDEDNPCTGEVGKPRINSMSVTTTITARYASTTVATEVINEAQISQETNFRFRLSNEAFISDFFMEVDGRIYQSEVKEKEEAQRVYDDARSQNQTVAQVKLSDDDFTKFETNINLSPNTTASFHLTFQELLRRQNGVYQLKINLFPEEVVPVLRAEVYITEPQGISFANVSWEQDERLPTDFLQNALNVNKDSSTLVIAMLHPSREDQEGLSETGINGDLVITYDVDHDIDAGNIEVLNNYFVHHISPVDLTATKKNVIFVIDTSGSMGGGAGSYGSKLSQTKLAMATIIDEIRPFDTFNILRFSDEVQAWERGLVVASGANKQSAKDFVDGLVADGGTDINQGLDEAISKLKAASMQSDSRGLSMIIFLTDGQPTSGVTDRDEIIRLATESIQEEIALFGLAFGEDADFDLLEKLSGFNQGQARKITSEASPSMQLHGFYEEVATPLLYNVDIRYSEGAVDLEKLTRNSFISYFKGTEMVVAGKIKDAYQGNQLVAVVTADSFDAPVEYELTKDIETSTDVRPHEVDAFAERLWAYLTVQDLLFQHRIALTDDEKDRLRDEATQIALEYKFVTPLTSLIVVKPKDDVNNNDDVLSFEGGSNDEGSAGQPYYPGNTGSGSKTADCCGAGYRAIPAKWWFSVISIFVICIAWNA